MRDLRTIIEEKQPFLPKDTAKLVAKFYNKIKYGSYFPDNKNILKLEVFSTNEVNNFLLECLNEYNKTPLGQYLEHHDVRSLRGVWAVLTFSKEQNVLDYFDDIINNTYGDRWLALPHIFEIFNYPNINHPYAQKIKKYYDDISQNLASYQLMEKLNISLPNRYNFSIHIILVNFGDFFTTNDMNDEEKERQIRLEIIISNPLCFDSTFEISVENSLPQKHKKITYEENIPEANFFINSDKNVFKKPDLLTLNTFLCEIEDYFGTKFITDKPAYLSVTKGINRKKITQWINNKFE